MRKQTEMWFAVVEDGPPTPDQELRMHSSETYEHVRAPDEVCDARLVASSFAPEATN